ncbi:calcineurin phosphoesterase [Pseudoxanthomonas broegbernensis]|uniref:Calcineurin phosphoesterase n=1 Tax=Pseudoxanthomonas broegbernensis TaxID=83619 RepID=A0A7V8K5X6_9GAMM|nr:calcineurin-like phosphoesterase family protein [Pseudoxanthomonas broegbernensis]KAF1684993.1 calcineurin phosphoesterase [Pseudoxanthomonas broegbernensis]MBB6064863.1 hypothetical protein [Pseudoxanthomonas broegbernensis]
MPISAFVLLAGLATVPAVPDARAAGQAHGTATVSGQVYLERDGHPGRTADEPGLAGVAVSNGRDIARTDARDCYRISAMPGQAVFVVKPAGYRFMPGTGGLPDFWTRVVAPGPMQADFALLAAGGPDDGPGDGARDAFEVLLFADTQVKSARDIDYYRRDIVEPLQGRHAASFGITLGDLVDDAVALYPALNAVTLQLGVPWFHVPGNHDVDPGARDDGMSLAHWEAVYGPDTYAVEEGAATFVFLDDVVVKADGDYAGGLREDQFLFLERYLAQVPRDRLLVLGMHVPLFDGGRRGFRADDRARLFALLRDRPRVLVLSGHSHTQQHYWHGVQDGWEGRAPLHEYNVGAACGAFWSGAPDAAGIPDATMSDGTPNGHATLSVRGDGGYALAYHPARVADGDSSFTTAMALHAPRVLRRGAYPAWGVYANVFMGDAATRVEYRIDGGEWTPMRRVERADPRLLAENAADDLAPALRGYDRSPEATASTHLWRGALATGLDPGEHRIEVRAFDRWQGEAMASTSYVLQEMPADRGAGYVPAGPVP